MHVLASILNVNYKIAKAAVVDNIMFENMKVNQSIHYNYYVQCAYDINIYVNYPYRTLWEQCQMSGMMPWQLQL